MPLGEGSRPLASKSYSLEDGRASCTVGVVPVADGLPRPPCVRRSDAADAHAADELVVVDGGDQHLKGASGRPSGGDVAQDGVKQGLQVGARHVRVQVAVPSRPEQNNHGESSCSSVASRSISSSRTSSMTSLMRASGRSILLMATTGGSVRCAFCSTKRVWACGPPQRPPAAERR